MIKEIYLMVYVYSILVLSQRLYCFCHRGSWNRGLGRGGGPYCKFINVCEGFIWRISQPSLNRKNKYPANVIHVQLTRPKLTANINPCEHVFSLKNANINPANINEFTVFHVSARYPSMK